MTRPVTKPTTFFELMRIDKAERARLAAKVAKAIPSFAERQASADLTEWVWQANQALADVITAAVTIDPDGPEVTPEQRSQAVAVSVDEFKTELLAKVGAALGANAGTAATVGKSRRVAKSPSVFKGIL